MAVMGRLIVSGCCAGVSALLWYLVYLMPLVLRVIPDDDIQLLGMWTVAYMILVGSAGLLAIVTVGIWTQND